MPGKVAQARDPRPISSQRLNTVRICPDTRQDLMNVLKPVEAGDMLPCTNHVSAQAVDGDDVDVMQVMVASWRPVCLYVDGEEALVLIVSECRLT